jgi:hypothetical protein
VGSYEDILFVHNMTPQTASCIFKVMATSNFERLVPWFCWIQSDLQLEHHVWLGIFGVKQGHQVHTKVHQDITNHLETQTFHDY